MRVHRLPPPHRATRGFTLVEQLAVIALVGTVAAGALPAMAEFNQQAERTLLHSLAATAGSAMLLNQAGCLVRDGQPTPGKCQPLQDCQQVQALLMQPLPAGFVVPAQTLTPDGVTCWVLRTRDGAAAGFHGVGTRG